LTLERADPGGITIIEHLRALLPRLGVDVVIDVGAHQGEYARRVRDSGFRGRIVSIEPTRANFDALALASRNDDAWDVHHLALGRARGRMSLHVTANTQFSSFASPLTATVDAMPGARVVGAEEVEVEALDDVFDRFVPGPASRVFLKIDTQGWDQEVIAGAQRSLASIVAIQTELSVRPIYDHMPHYLDALGELERLGYLPTGLFPVARNSSLGLIELDCVAIRDGEPARTVRATPADA
jgi:FkbM family methyltransferase